MALGSSEAHSFTETYVLLSQGPLRCLSPYSTPGTLCSTQLPRTEFIFPMSSEPREGMDLIYLAHHCAMPSK